MIHSVRLAAAAILASLVVLGGGPEVAHAGIEACGNVDVSAQAQCEVKTSGGCTAQCEPTRLEAACAGKLDVQCQGQCNAAAAVECTGACSADCEGRCAADPGSFDCNGTCDAQCGLDCTASCATRADSGRCQVSCKASCSERCQASCQGTPPSATCKAKCDASCSGSCKAKANATCQVECQSQGFAQCTANLEGGCKAQCDKPEGALFCDGNYVDSGGNLQACVDALNAFLAAHVKVSGSARGECNGGECSGTAEGEAACAAVAPGSKSLDGRELALAALGILFILAGLRRRGPRHRHV